MQKLRIALLSMFNGSVLRGVESWSVQLCHHLSRLGHESVLIQGGENLPDDRSFRTVSLGFSKPELSQMDYTNQNPHVHAASMRLYMLEFAARCMPHLYRIDPDVVIPVNSTAVITAALKAYKFFRRKSRIILRTPGGFNANLRAALRVGADGIAASEPAALASISQESKVPAKLIPLGVDVARFENAGPIESGLKGPIALVVSALVPIKRVHLAIEACARGEMSLLVIGDGPLHDEIEALGRQLLGENRFQLKRAVQFNDIPGYYKSADVFTLPSHEGEAFGVVILEALAACLPVVVNDDRVRRWIVKENGYFVNPEDSSNYAQTLRLAASKGKFETAPQFVHEFDWSKIAQEWSDFCVQVAGTK